MNVTLNPEQAKFLQSQLASGQYESADEVINAALKAMEQDLQRIAQQHQVLQQQLVAIETQQIQNEQAPDRETIPTNPEDRD